MNEAAPSPLLTGVAWSGTDLIVTDPNLIDKRLRRSALSASTSKSMRGCLVRWAGEKLLPRVSDPFAVSELGTSTHAVLEDLYNANAPTRTTDLFADLRDEHSKKQWSLERYQSLPDNLSPEGVPVEFDEWVKNQDRWKSEVDRLGLRTFEIEDPRETVVYKTELPFDGVTIAGGVPAMGYIDRVDIEIVRGEERFVVVDLKTGKQKSAFDLNRYGDDHGDQIRIYYDAIRALLGVAPAAGRIHYTQFGTSREIPLTELALEKTRKDFRAAWDIHNRVTENGRFPAKTGPLCGWCPLVNACPAAAAAGKKASDKLDTPPATAVALGIPTVRTDAIAMGSKEPYAPAPAPLVTAATAARSIAAAPASPPVAPTAEVAPADPFAASAPAPAPVVAPVPAVAPVIAFPVAAAQGAAHGAGDNADPNGTGTPTVNNEQPLFSEGKPWEPTINGRLNGASYSAMGVIGLTQVAGELLVEAGRPLNGQTLDQLTDLLAEVIVTVQKSVRNGDFDWDAGINTRIRGALRTTIETLPLPWDATTEDAWVEWKAKAIKRTRVFVVRAIRLYNLGDTVTATSFSALLPVGAAASAPVAAPVASPSVVAAATPIGVPRVAQPA